MSAKKFIPLFITAMCMISASAFSSSADTVSPASSRWANWRKGWKYQFPTAAWSFFSRYSGSVAEYTTYKNAGFTMVQAPFNQYGNAASAGLKVLMGGWEKLYNDSAKLNTYIGYPSPSNPSTTAYNLVDEPADSLFTKLGISVEKIYENDQRDAIPFISMLPNWAVGFNRFHMTYEDFVDLFIQEVNPAVMASTHYPIMCDGTDRPEYYQNIELFRNRALASNIGLMGFVCITPYQNSKNSAMCYRPASESDIYWQVYSMIAYGAQGIWYYNYRIGDDAQFGEGIVFHGSGEPNPAFYPYIQHVDSQLHNLAHVLMKLQSVGVYHLHSNAAAVPAGTVQYSNGVIPAITAITGDSLLVSEFRNQDDSNDTTSYVMVVNKRHAMGTASSALPASATLTVDPAFGYVYKFDPDSGRQVLLTGSSNQYTITLNGGNGLLLRLSKTAQTDDYEKLSPAISYSSPQVYQQGTAITPLSPVVSGDIISPAVIYGQTGTVAGNATAGSTDSTGTSASFTNPGDITFDHAGNMYVADYGNHLIRKISPAGDVSTLAGAAGVIGTANGSGTDARFRNPNGIAVDGIGNIYIADRNNHRIRKIDTSMQVTTLAGSSAGYVDGDVSVAKFSAPIDVVVDSTGNLYVLEVNGNRIRKISTTGQVTTLAGSGTAGYADGVGTSASFNAPYSMALDKADNLYVADRANNRIRKVTPDGHVSTLAGNGTAGTVDSQDSASAEFNAPSGIAIDNYGNVYVSDYSSHHIRKISPGGAVSTLAGSTSGLSDGIGAIAQFKNPFGITIDPAGNLYIADFGNNAIRRITLAGYSISPALPSGLSFDNQTGIITGTPDTSSPATDYSIKAYNGAGREAAGTTLNISVNNPFSAETTALGIRAATVNPDNTKSWSIYANPVTEGNDLTIILPHDQTGTSRQEVSIYDIAGRQIYKQALQPAGNKLTVSLPVRPVPGVYIVVVNGSEAKKFIIK